MKNSFKKIVKALLVVIVLCVGCCVLGGVYLVHTTLQTKQGQDMIGSRSYICEQYPYLTQWLDSVETRGLMRDTFLLNKEGLRLTGKFIPAARSTRRTAVGVHGYTDNSYRIMQIGNMYSQVLGYNVLLPNLQYHGDSEGDEIQMGWKDRLDVLEWMDLANTIFGGNTEMVVHGISMGAATTMCVSGEKAPPYVRCFVADCGYTSVWDQFSDALEKTYGLPTFPLLDVASFFCELQFGWNFKEASPLEQVKKCALPMFFIHGTKDDYVPTWMMRPLFEAKPGEKDLWYVDGAVHAVSYKENREEYTTRVKAFNDQYMRD